MTNRDILAALAALPDDAHVTVTVRKADVVRALAQHERATAENLTTIEASARFGFTADRWRRWAADGTIEGAWQPAEGGPWQLPTAACERHLQRLKRGGPTPPRSDAKDSKGKARRPQPRGPRRMRAVAPLPASPSHAGSGTELGIVR